MKKRLNLLGFATAFMIAGACLTFTAHAAEYKILLNGAELTTTQQIQNVNDRIMVPFRDVGEAMGAQIYWEAGTAKISAYRGNRYSIMHVEQTTVQYGEFSTGVDGAIVYETNQTYELDAAPAIIGNSTYIPVRALAETLGATVHWDVETGTASITATLPQAPVTEDFSDTGYFKHITAEESIKKYDNSDLASFAFVLYDSSTTASHNGVTKIKEAAEEAKVVVYALDRNSEDYTDEALTWLSKELSKDTFKDPTVYLVGSGQKITELPQPYDVAQLAEQLTGLVSVGNTKRYEQGNFTKTTYFTTRSPGQINSLYKSKDNFVLWLYSSENEDSKRIVPAVKTAAENEKLLIYGLDISKTDNYYRTLSWTSDYSDDEDKLPVLYLCYSNGDVTSYENISTVTAYEQYFREFIKKSDYYADYSDVATSGYFLNADAEQIYKKIEKKEDFFLVLYDARVEGNRKMVEDIIQYIKETEIKVDGLFYGLNEGSKSMDGFTDEEKKDYLEWIDKNDHYFEEKDRPFLIYFTNGLILDILDNPTPERISKDYFIYRYFKN